MPPNQPMRWVPDAGELVVCVRILLYGTWYVTVEFYRRNYLQLNSLVRVPVLVPGTGKLGTVYIWYRCWYRRIYIQDSKIVLPAMQPGVKDGLD